jgi:cyclophilin family peptidyl-prolyl cis-trans isomerase
VTKCVPNLLIEAGNVGGDGKKTIYGNTMPKESTDDAKFDKRGVVAMVDMGEDSVGSKFFITLGDFSYLNYKAVVVGEVVEGLSDLFSLSRLGDSHGNLPAKVVISDCKEGETLHLVEPHHGHGHGAH